MATYVADTCTAGRAFIDNGGAGTMEIGVTTQTANLVITDTVRLVRVAGGTKLCELLVWNGDLDTGTTLQFSLGYRKCNTGGSLADNDTYFAAAGQTTWQAAVLGSAPTRYAFVPITFPEDVFITAVISASATGIAASPTITAMASGIAVGVST
jgi:hypothetical protein